MSIESVDGSVEHLIGQKVLLAEEVVGPGGKKDRDHCVESFLWTYYTIATGLGTVVIRWYGISNGYYSESVDVWKE